MEKRAVDWVRAVGKGDSDRQIAVRAHIPTGTLGRQMANDLLSPDNIVAIARAYKVSPLDGLVALGLIEEDDIRRAAAGSSAADMTDEDILREVSRRLGENRDDHSELTAPMDDLPN